MNLAAELLGVVEAMQPEIVRQDYRRCQHGAGKGSAAHFVYAGHDRDPVGAQLVFML